MVKHLSILMGLLLLIGNSQTVFAQEEDPIVKEGLVKFTGSLEPGYLFAPKVFSMYLSGNLEYYLEDRLSIRGDLYYFIPTSGSSDLIKANHGLFFGPACHFGKGNIDPYIGIQPGIQLTKVGFSDPILTVQRESSYKLIPVASVITGAHFYVNRFFNFYLAARGVFGSFRGGDAPNPVPMNEIRFTAGLGFNFSTKK